MEHYEKEICKASKQLEKSFGITFVTYGMVFIEKLLRNCMMKLFAFNGGSCALGERWVYHLLRF